MNEPALLQREKDVAIVVLNRPERLNAMNRPMWSALKAIFSDLSMDESVRCVVVRGAGKAFSPGADITEFTEARGTPEQAAAYGQVMDDTYQAIRDCPHPIVGAIHGPCTGVGMVLALLCDLRIAADSGKFGAPVSRLGLAMPLSEFAILSDAVGRANALEIVLEARVFDAEEALKKGIVQRMVTEKMLAASVDDTVERILAGAPLVNRWHKAFAKRLASPAPLTEIDRATSYQSFATEDYREGITAFLEKRKPAFQGR